MALGTSFLPNLAEVRQDVLDAMTRQPISHRSPEFHELFAGVQNGLREVFRTTRPVYVATASGTAMMEAAVRCAPCGRLLAVVNGMFGERFATIARACGRDVDRYVIPFGDVPDPDEIRELLKNGRYSALTVVHSETSTGALADVAAIARVARAAGVAVIVDSVSGIGGARIETDEWQLDCVISASQKALGLPPGISFVVASEKFLSSARDVEDRGLYLDLTDYDRHARNCETPTTPNVSLIFALAKQLQAIAAEGMEARWRRHEAMRAMMEQWVATTRDLLGIDIALFARAGARSPTVTTVSLPSGMVSTDLVRKVAQRGFAIGTGHGVLRLTTFRIGHMGEHSVAEVESCLGTVADELKALRTC